MTEKCTLKAIRELQNFRNIFCALQVLPGCKYLRNKCDEKKDKYINDLLDELVTNTELHDKYFNYDISNLEKIGNRIWIFWYTGFETAPPIVKKCVSITQSLTEADVILLDKNNLEEYFVFEGRIKELFKEGKISIQAFSDILRCQLLSRHGGFWFDATLFPTRKDIIKEYSVLPYWTIKHSKNDLLLKQKWNEYFTKGLWTIYCCASGKNNPLFSFLYDTYINYFNRYDDIFNYFQIAYIWLYSYENFEWVQRLVNDVKPTVSCSYFLGQNLQKTFNKDRWNEIIKDNYFQKLNWRINDSTKKASNSYYKYFMEQSPENLLI